MNAALRTVERAITKLEVLREGATPGRWVHVNEPYGDIMSEQEPGLGVETVVASELDEFDGTLVVTLYRTIESQLIILRMFAERIQQSPGYEPPIRSEHMALAHAILGGDL